MSRQTPPALDLEAAIDQRPLTASPETVLSDLIGMMGLAQSSCVLPHLNLTADSSLTSQIRANTVFIERNQRLVGMFTVQEALQAIAAGHNLKSTPAEAVMRAAPVFSTARPALSSTAFVALATLREHQLQQVPVVDTDHRCVGMMTAAYLRRVLPLDELLKTQSAKDIVLSSVVQAPATETVQRLTERLVEHQTDTVLLTGPDISAHQPIGLMTARDILQLQALGLDLSNITADQVMTPVVPCFSASESALAVYWQMQQQRVQQAAIADEQGLILGIVTPVSCLYTLNLARLQQTVEQIQTSIAEFEAQKALPSHLGISADLDPPSSDDPAELREQLQCSHLLARMAFHIRESLDLDNILQTAVEEVRRSLQTDRVLIYQFNPDLSGTVVVESAAAEWHPALNSTLKDTCFGQNYAQAYKAGRTQVVEDIYTAGLTQCHIDILALFDVRASLVVPILQGEHLWGLLCAYQCSGPRQWRPFEVTLLQQLATHMAIAIQQSELYQQVQNELAERKRAEEKLKVSLWEKEALLREIHHRVKNNLQIISSVLRLQSDYVKNETALALFRDSQDRIRSMALIHEKLYQSRDLLRIDLNEYIHDLTANLLHSYMAAAQHINLLIETDDIYLNIDTAIPCGLIINELVSNALKHAFPNVYDGHQIQVTVRRAGPKTLTLQVSDNGVGFPEELDFRNTESLGLELVCIFTEQLDGNIELNRDRGTTFTITFSETGDLRGN